jgi:hypothetical protein
MSPDLITELVTYIEEWERNEEKKAPDSFYKYLSINTGSLIKSSVMQDKED